MAQTPALESIFANAEQSAQSMIAAATTGINSKINTIEAAEQLVATLSNEAAKFNQHLLAISNAMHQLEIGDISQEEARATIVPCVQALKSTCSALKFADVQMSDSDDITEEEIAILRELIIGVKAAADARLVTLKTSSTPGQISTEGSGILASLINMDPVQEGLFGGPTGKLMNSIRKSTDAKTAQSLYGNAKKMWGYGQKEKAKEYLLKAQALYEKCLKKVMESGHFKTVTNTTTTSKPHLGKQTETHSQVSKERTADSKYALAARNYFEDRIDSCKALMLQWENKAGKATYAETKAQLKAERAEARRAQREAKKNTNGGNTSMNPTTESLLYGETDLTPAQESYARALEASLDQLAMEEYTMAMESDGTDAEGSSKGGLIKRLIAKFKKEKNDGDETAAAASAKEVDNTMSELESDINDADTPEKKKKVNTAIIIAIGAVALAAGFAYGAKSGKFETIMREFNKHKAAINDNIEGDNKAHFAWAKALWRTVKTAPSRMSAIAKDKAARAAENKIKPGTFKPGKNAEKSNKRFAKLADNAKKARDKAETAAAKANDAFFKVSQGKNATASTDAYIAAMTELGELAMEAVTLAMESQCEECESMDALEAEADAMVAQMLAEDGYSD